MGKKKQFIDKKKAVNFRLVHRSQRDPLQADDESSQHVLLPVANNTELDNSNQATSTKKEVVEERKKELHEHGVYFDDGYDYLQHMKQRTETHLEPLPSNVTVVEAKKPDKKKFGNFTLPSEAFASHYEEDEGLLNLAAPISGPRPDWDPDIVAALDDAIDLNDPANILDDDFILIANGDAEMGSGNEYDDEDYCPSDEDTFGDDDDDDSLYDNGDDSKSRMSNYSMTSSVIRRTHGLSLLDDRFDKIMEEYDDEEIGALDHEEVGGKKNLNDPLLESIKNEFLEDGGNKRELLEVTRTKVSFDLPEEGKRSSNDGGFVKLTENPNEQWDCESILSTYSNLYNHPTLIEESSKKFVSRAIPLSKREGIPLGILSDGIKKINNDNEETVGRLSRVSHARSREETKDEKKSRKQVVKQERQTRRVEKKTNKLLFKEETKRQEKSASNSALLVGQKIH